MIAGIGIDIINPSRLERTIEQSGQAFLERVFTTSEIEYCEGKKNKNDHYAARFAAKEALLKAFGTGLRGKVSWKDITISKDSLGAPYIELSGQAQALAEEAGIKAIHLSLSHDGDVAVAMVVLEK